MNSPLLIIGSNGQVGRALMDLSDNAIGVTRREIDLEKVAHYPYESGMRPAAIINAAAYTAVDKAEEEEIRAHRINAVAPEVLARYCRDQGIPFVHYSTDYVFDGSGHTSWKESDIPNPLSAYGRTKLLGEKKITETGGDYLIFRTSWVYDETGKNFLNTMLRLGVEREQLKVVNDQWGAPTYARHLAQATLTALENAMRAPRFPSGIYHLCGGGETTWHGFAEEIFAEARAQGHALRVEQVQGIPSSEYLTPARRPQNSRLDCSKAKQVLGVELPPWEEGLRECLGKATRSVALMKL